MARLALLLVAVALFLPASAGAAFAPFDAAGVVHADGERYAAFDRAGLTRVVDTATGSVTDVAEPGVCHVRDVAARQVLWECPDAAWLLDLRTGHVRVPPGWESLPALYPGSASGGSFHPHEVGRRWIRLDALFYRQRDTLLLNWRTGAVVRADDRNPRAFNSVDAVRPIARMCRPLRRRTTPGFEEPYSELFDRFEAFVYSSPFGIAMPVRDRDALVLQRCGSRKRRQLSRCPCGSVEISGGLVTWSQPSGRRSAIYAYSLRTGRRVRVGSVPRTPGSLYLPTVAHTANTVFVSESDTGTRRYSAPLPLRLRPRPR